MSESSGEGGLFAEAQGHGTGEPGTVGRKNVRKRWLVVGASVAVFAIAVSSLMSDKTPLPERKPEPAPLINLTPENVDQRSWQVRSQEDIYALKNQNDELKATLQGLREEIGRLKSTPLPANVVPPPSLPSDGQASMPYVPSVPPPPSINLRPGMNGGVAVPPPFSDGSGMSPAEPMVFMPERSAERDHEVLAEVESKTRYKRNAQSGMLVAGAFAPVVLLNGLDAGTSSTARSNPLPVLMRVQDNAVLPGSAKYQLRSCFILGSAYGELSAPRVYVRLARLSCVDKDKRLVLSSPIQGYVVDADNILGLRGEVHRRDGGRLAKSMLAGFAQGLSSALGGAQGTVTMGSLGSATSLAGDEALRASGLNGASTAAGQLAQFYLREAQAMFPVITVEGGRAATVVFLEDTPLSWGEVDAQYIREVEPRDSREGG